MHEPRVLLGGGSVALIAAATLSSAVLAPPDLRWLALLCAFLAIGAALQSAASEPGDLGAALLFSVPPLLGLLGDTAPRWLIVPLAACLLLAAELNVLAWHCGGVTPRGEELRRRVVETVSTTAIGGLAAAVIYAVGSLGRQLPSGGTLSVILAGVALLIIARLAFGPDRRLY